MSEGFKGLRIGYNSSTNNAFIAPVEQQSLGLDISTYYNSTFSPKVTFKDNGNVGIGTTTPGGQLEIFSGSNIATLHAKNTLSSGFTGTVLYGQSVQGNSTGYDLMGLYNNTSTLQYNVRGDGQVYMAGNVGIGTTTPHEALSVNGNIRSKQVKVESNNWPDYVFKPTYVLLSLSEVKTT